MGKKNKSKKLLLWGALIVFVLLILFVISPILQMFLQKEGRSIEQYIVLPLFATANCGSCAYCRFASYFVWGGTEEGGSNKPSRYY